MAKNPESTGKSGDTPVTSGEEIVGTPAAKPQEPAAPSSKDDLHSAIEKARMEEREKLRGQLDQLKGEVTTLKSANEKLQNDLKTAGEGQQKVSDQLEALKKGLKEGGDNKNIDVEAVLTAAVQAARSRLEAQYQDRITNLENQLSTVAKERERASLAQLRSQLIEEAGGSKNLIPEMVTGSNEQELRDSIRRSQDIFNRTVASVVPATPGHTAAPTSPYVAPVEPGAPLPMPPAQPGVSPLETRTPGRRMPLEEYKANRDTLRRDAAARYPTNVI